MRCNPEKGKKNKRVRTMRTWYSRQSRHVANIVSACHCCTYDLLITQGLWSRWRRRYHETLETFGHVLALGTVPNIYCVSYRERRMSRTATPSVVSDLTAGIYSVEWLQKVKSEYKFGQISKRKSPILWNLAKLASLLSKPLKFCEIQRKKSAKFWRKFTKSAVSIKNQQTMCRNLQKWCKSSEKTQKSGIVQKKKCRSRQELSNEYLLAKIGVDTAENEPLKVTCKQIYM